jgi:hypothetical protein
MKLERFLQSYYRIADGKGLRNIKYTGRMVGLAGVGKKAR